MLIPTGKREMWFTLGLQHNRETQEITIGFIGLSNDRRTAQMQGVNRVGADGFKYDHHGEFKLDGRTGTRLITWLRDHSVPRAIINSKVREIGATVDRLIQLSLQAQTNGVANEQ